MNKHTLPGLCAACLLPWMISAADYTITTDADFIAGSLQSLTHDPDNQLQISSTISTFPVLWIANAGEDTVSKIDTDNDCEVARYETWFNQGVHSAWGGPAPSRSAVDGDGNVFVANRHFDGRPVLILKILLEGGVDRNGNGVIDTSFDANNNCTIEPSEMIPLVDLNNNGVLDPNELADERVAFATPIPGTNGHIGRSLCIDPQGDLWAGTCGGTNAYYELSPADGSVLTPGISTGVCNYGCVIDNSGFLFGASLGGSLPVIDTTAKTYLGRRTHGTDYGIAAGNGKVYKARAASPYLIYDPNSGPGEPDGDPLTGTFTTPPVSYSSSLGIGVDGNGDILQGNTAIRKFKGADDTLIWSTPNPSGTGDTRGILADSNNDIWAVNLSNNNVTKFKGTDGSFLNTVPVGASPYTYSDATGIGFQIANPNGVFIGTLDSGSTGTKWDKVAWNTEPEGSVPAGSSIALEVRVADTQGGLPLATYAPVTNGLSGLGLMGQFIQLKATLTPNAGGDSPVLSDIVASTLANCDVNQDGIVDRLDISLITQARNTAAAPGDARDVDGNGVINVNDARQCVVKCDLPRCATPPN